jgi:hypothetical protein
MEVAKTVWLDVSNFAAHKLTCPSRYWQFLLYLFIILTIGELVLAPFHSLYPAYSSLIGYVGLSIEAILPLPQIFANARSRSCKGFRLSVLASWLLGDGMKMFWFFTSPTEIPLAFKLCGLFQAGCDSFLGIQYLMYGNGEGPPRGRSLPTVWPGSQQRPFAKLAGSGLETPIALRTPIISEKDS